MFNFSSLLISKNKKKTKKQQKNKKKNETKQFFSLHPTSVESANHPLRQLIDRLVVDLAVDVVGKDRVTRAGAATLRLGLLLRLWHHHLVVAADIYRSGGIACQRKWLPPEHIISPVDWTQLALAWRTWLRNNAENSIIRNDISKQNNH